MLALSAAACLMAQSSASIDNDQVRVTTVTDQPHAKSQPHEHKLNRVMVYMQAGQQTFVSQDGKKTTLSFKAGDVKWSPATGTHVSELTSNAPVTIVEIEVKKPGDPGKTVNTPLDPLKVDPKDYKLEFENSQVRVTRVRFAAHATAPMHEHVLNRVVVYLTDQNTRLTGADGKVDVSAHKAGEASWGSPTKHQEENLMNGPMEALVVEFKS
jgi:quercetin dioxygenase-like cupin family protein